MTNLRFGVIAAATFVLAFIAISFASKGLPVLAARLAAVKQHEAQAPSPVRVAPQEQIASVEPQASAPIEPEMAVEAEPQPPEAQAEPKPEAQAEPKPEPQAKPQPRMARSAEDKARDKLRLELWQAAIGYNLMPCEASMKRNLVEALSNYTRAWADRAGCYSGDCISEGKRVEIAAAVFKTPADLRVQQAVREALQNGGVTRADFPKSIGDNALLFIGQPLRRARASCVPAVRADNIAR